MPPRVLPVLSSSYSLSFLMLFVRGVAPIPPLVPTCAPAIVSYRRRFILPLTCLVLLGRGKCLTSLPYCDLGARGPESAGHPGITFESKVASPACREQNLFPDL